MHVCVCMYALCMCACIRHESRVQKRLMGLCTGFAFGAVGTMQAAARADWMGFINIGAFKIRIGFWGPLYYNYKKEPPK